MSANGAKPGDRVTESIGLARFGDTGTVLEARGSKLKVDWEDGRTSWREAAMLWKIGG